MGYGAEPKPIYSLAFCERAPAPGNVLTFKCLVKKLIAIKAPITPIPPWRAESLCSAAFES